MRDNDNRSNNIAHSRHSDTIKNKLNIVQRIVESSKAKSGAYIFVATVNNGEKSTIAREFLPIYETKSVIRFGILSFKSNIKPRNVRVNPMPVIEPLEMSWANTIIKMKHNIDIGDFNFSLITKLVFLKRTPNIK